MSTSPQRLSTYEKIRRLPSVEQVQGWRDNLRAGLLGRDPLPDEISLLMQREKELLDAMTPKQRKEAMR